MLTTRRALSLMIALSLALLGLAACSDDDSSSDDTTTSADTETSEPDADSSSDDSVPEDEDEAADEDGGDDAAEPTGDLELPDGADMAARITVESGEWAGTSEIVSESPGSCALGLFTPDEYSVSYSTIVLDGEEPDGETTGGAEVYSFGLDVVIDGGGSGEGEGEAGAVFDEDSAYNDIEDEEAAITVEEDGEGARFTFEGESADGDPFSGEVICASVTA